MSSKRSEKQVCTAGRSDHADRSGDLPRISRHHPSSESSMNRCYMLWYTTLCRALRGTCWVGWFVRTRRVRHGYASEPFLCIPLASSSVPEASLLSSGLRLYRTLIRCYRGCQSPPEEGWCAVQLRDGAATFWGRLRTTHTQLMLAGGTLLRPGAASVKRAPIPVVLRPLVWVRG